ncbi:MAG TPA: UDP-N-acetylmuramoyl-L-alanyl-D-glutamate--2,6-diaminopimelate ligase, partial [Rhodocyclaceae bacterium]|nr:UDP-N-acetylmuramoyl-L-alanyl-D-glutamate--2,6-diaminopimelate ligase [Rhodocyclaceae bacterium]
MNPGNNPRISPAPNAPVAALLAELKRRGITAVRLCNDSRRVQRGDVFVAYPGAKSDGRSFIAEVLERGAALVLAEAAGLDANAAAEPRVLAVAQLRELLGELAAAVHGHPASHLHLIGVTGTNGKTSSTQWIASTLAAAGQRCAQIGTLGNGFPGELDQSANTTPDALTLHSELQRYLDAGAVACAMEVSSIGLDQGRCNGASFSTAVFTNLTRDHLDYHGEMAAYAAAKRRLFVWPGLQTAVVNVDDPFGRELLALTTARRKIAYSLRGAESGVADVFLHAGKIEHTARGLSFEFAVDNRVYTVEAPVVGDYNVANLLAVAGALLGAGVDERELPSLLSGVLPPPGRMQRYGGAYAPLVAVDYAHTPDALENALAALRPAAVQRGGKLVCIFGCGGDRDRGKRPLMGQVATRLADMVWVTSDNPRSEDPAAIIAEIVGGAGPAARVEIDRRSAIAAAIGEATAADVLLVAGKGHEDYQEIRGRKFPYSDALVVNAQLAAWREAQESDAANRGRTETMMMTLLEAATATDGQLSAGAADLVFDAVSTDSRSIVPGMLFVALSGERFDAHDFIAEVAHQGAVAAVVRADRVAELADLGLPLIAVDDPRLAFGRLAKAWRRRFAIPVVAVTGSNGKTTTKEMIAAILRAQAVLDGAGADAVLATQGNLNNDIGLPLTLLGLRPKHRYAVVELGMNHPGEIAYLADIAAPDAAVVINALRAHLEGMGSLDGVAREKGSLFEYVKPDGVAVIAADAEFVPLWKTQAGSRRTLAFSLQGNGEVNAAVKLEALGARIELQTPSGVAKIFLQAPGLHNAHNATAAAALCLAVGISLEAVTQGLNTFAGVKGRLQKKNGLNGALLIDDTYNANPDSVIAAIDVL